MTAVSRLGPLLLIRNASVLPGTKVNESLAKVSVVCGAGTIRLTVEGTGRDEINNKMCDTLASAVSHGAVLQGVDPPPVAVHIGFAQRKAYVFERTRSLTTGGPPRMRLVLPTLDTRARTTANAVEVASHEAYHLFAALARRPADIVRNEDIGHLVGACSVLMILGELHEQESGGSAAGADLHGPVATSHDAGVRLRERLAPLFASKDALRAGSEAADHFVSMCESIPSMFSTKS